MSSEYYMNRCRDIIAEYYNSHREITSGSDISKDDVYVVWFCKSLQNHKALLSTTVPDGMYYEVTYDGDRSIAYVDAYKKWQNFAVEV